MASDDGAVRAGSGGSGGSGGSTRPARRHTRQRAAVAAALEGTDEFLSAQDLHAVLRAGGDRIGLATVYRSLQTLADDGAVDVRRGEDGEATYRRCSTGHHHHLVCRTCGRTVEVESREVERWAAGVAHDSGFVDAVHTVEITGSCPACAAAPGTPQPGAPAGAPPGVGGTASTAAPQRRSRRA